MESQANVLPGFFVSYRARCRLLILDQKTTQTMLNGDLKTYIQYFQAWAEAHADIRFFCFGSVEKGIEFARSLPDFNYPFCWLEQPIIQPTDNGAMHLNERFQTGICILIKAAPDDHQAQIDAYDLSLSTLTDLHAKLIRDHRKNRIQLDPNSLRKEPVDQLWVDSHYGYRMEFTLELNNNNRLIK
ncbi:hypothetical protein GCM10027347_17760 [Larkinella harenae]